MRHTDILQICAEVSKNALTVALGAPEILGLVIERLPVQSNISITAWQSDSGYARLQSQMTDVTSAGQATDSAMSLGRTACWVWVQRDMSQRWNKEGGRALLNAHRWV